MLLLLLAVVFLFPSRAQVNAYFNYGIFNTPQQQPFLETYLTIVGNSLLAKQNNGHYQSSVNILLTIFKDTSIVKASKYNLLGPEFNDTLHGAPSFPSFIDQHRYALPNGTYTVEMVLTDNYKLRSKPLTIRETVTIDFKAMELDGSSIELVESFKKTATPGPVSKSGFDLIPYSVNYFPESSKELAFYFEAYNTDTALGSNKPFVYYYYLETSNLFKLSSYGAFKKQPAQKVNPLIGKIDISKLGTGNYNLVIEIKDANNKVHLQKKQFFQRFNNYVDVVAQQNYGQKKNVAEYFGQCNNMDTLRMFVECLWPIANGLDKERIINQSLRKEPELMKQFVIDFWQRRAADTVNPLKLWAAYYKNVQTVMALFRCGKQKGYYTDRGRVFLQYGAPSQRSQQPNEANAYPYEIWQYYRTSDATNGQFFSNRKFVFVNKNLGDDCYMLVHSDMRGELNNPRWQFEVSRSQNQGMSNPDQTVPENTQFNQFNEIYSNPR